MVNLVDKDRNEMNGLKDPLLSRGVNDSAEPKVTGYAAAGFVSRACFWWLNSFLKVGASKSLEYDDVPELAPGDRAEELFQRVNFYWEKQERTPHSFRNILLRTFGWPLAQCGILALIKVCVAYVGPALISRFMIVISGQERFPYEGYFLVLVLLIAKTLEGMANHQLTFQTTKLGMQVRSSVISVVYRKGLRLSSSARESQGSGKIVNLLSVDAQNLADCCLFLHNFWSIPVQMAIAGAILCPQLGLPTLAGLAVLIVSGSFSYAITNRCRLYQNGYLRFKDDRVQAIVESLANMKIIKLQAWDDKFSKRVADARAVEFAELVKFTVTTSLLTGTCLIAPVISCIATFGYAVYLGQTISVGTAFTTITIARSFQELLRLFPNLTYTVAQAMVSLERLERYLWSEELQADAVDRLAFGASEDAVVVETGSFKWEVDAQAPTLQDIHLKIKAGSLVAVVGKVGAGKSSLLSALQGEMPRISGTIKTCGRTGCVSQTAWIQNATIQDNVLFGRPLEKERYELVLEKCALVPDLAQMPFGDKTEIGERGLNLSGGQKQRIQLARALYQDCDIYFLDDIFSAVDAHTGSHLFRECVLGALAEKTVLLVTHQIEFLPKADLVLVLRDGKIVQSGKYEELLGEGTDLEALVLAHHEALEKVDTGEEGLSGGVTTSRNQSTNLHNVHNQSTENGTHMRNGTDNAHRYPPDSQDVEDEDKDAVKGSEGEGGRLVLDECKESGGVSLRIYWAYVTNICYGIPVIAMIIVLVVGQTGQIASDYWVGVGSKFDENDFSQAKRFIYVYIGLSLFSIILQMTRPAVSGVLGCLASQRYFFGMLRSVFRAPMSFFDTTPNGRILSRATTDQTNVDFIIPALIGGTLAIVITVLGTLIVTSLVVREVLVMVIPLCLFMKMTQGHYLKSSRELTRLDGLTKAPIIHHFSETISGFSTIRCFSQQERFIQTNVNRINASFKMDFHSNASMEWVGVRMELTGCFFICFTAFLLVASGGILAPEQVGLALTYTLNLNSVIYALAWFSCILENKMISVERLQQFSNLPNEAELIREDSQLPPDWPVIGSIELVNFKLRYRPSTPLVLKGITMKVDGGEKVGVVGRTGSGKSTLILALFRLVESSGGRILIDGTDISTLGLHDLRSRLSIIPQEPTLIEGTIRINLDPLGKHSDAEIWQALEKCQLSKVIGQLEGKLDSRVTSNGENWSVGQRQLFCLGRVLLKKSRILVLDEATSSVDTETDAVMQKILRQDFTDCTVISIAHRIPSVMDSDKVLVLDAGIVKEYDSPSVLLEQPYSLFSALVAQYSTRADT